MPKTDWTALKSLTELKFLKQSQAMQKLVEKDNTQRDKFEALRKTLVEGSKQQDIGSSMALHERNKQLWFQRGLLDLQEINRQRALIRADISEQKGRVAHAYGQDNVVDALAKKAAIKKVR